MGFKDILSKMNLVEFEESPKKENVFRKEEYKPPTEVKVINTINYDSVSSNNIQVEQFKLKFKSILEEENKRNFPGNDFFEFWQMENSMKGIISQESVRYPSAFATWNISSKSPQTKQALIDTANIYLSLVEKEITIFKEEYNAEFNKQVTANKTLIENKTKEMQELSAKLEALAKEVDTLKKEDSENTKQLTEAYNSFMVAGEAQKQEILSEINNINQYI